MSGPDTVKVEIGWKGSSTGLFVIDTSTLDGSDTLGTSLPSGFDADDDFSYPPPATRTSYAKTVEYRRGRDSNMGEMAMGTATITLHDPAQDLNPNNPLSPLAGTLEVGRPVRVTAEHDTVSYPVLYQFVRAIDPQPEQNETLIRCVDLFSFLHRDRPLITPLTDTTTGEAIGEILDAIGWTDPSMRDLGMGDTLADWPHIDMPADGSRTAGLFT